MILIIGLGNPGEKYGKTRHNIGFRVLDELARKNNFSKFKFSKELSSLISKGKLNNKKMILAKPQTFMNLSGKAIKPLTEIFLPNKARAELSRDLWVVHDEIDLPLGKLRIAIGRGTAGHKGVESIIKKLGTKNFVRFRIGIQPKTDKPKNVERFVLQKFNKKEEKIVKEVVKKTVEAIEMAIKEGVEKAQSEFNK